MKKISILIFITSFMSCSVNLTKGEKVEQIFYEDLPKEVQKAYYNLYEIGDSKRFEYISLDEGVEMEYVKSTGIEIVRPGKKIIKIKNRKFHIPWNMNREVNPYIYSQKYFYCVVGEDFGFGDSRNTYTIGQLKNNKFLKIDLRKYFKY